MRKRKEKNYADRPGGSHAEKTSAMVTEKAKAMVTEKAKAAVSGGECVSHHNTQCLDSDVDTVGPFNTHLECCQACESSSNCWAWTWDWYEGKMCHLMASCNSVSNGVPGSERYHSGWYDGYGPWSKGSIATAAKFTKVAEKAKAACDKVESSSGQEQIWVPGCQGVGCKANGHDNDCAWCVYDMSACESKYGNACHQTERAREAQGINGCSGQAAQQTIVV